MQKIWHFSNTTLRNPMRLADGLKVLKDSKYHGNLVGADNEEGYAIALHNAGVVNITDLTRDNSSMGRKWRVAFSQLGFITFKPKAAQRAIYKSAIEEHDIEGLNPDGQFEITPNGKRLISSSNVFIQQEAMLRALLAYQLPSIIEDKYEFEAFKPFVFILQVLKELKSQGHKGLSKYEFTIITTYHSHDDVEDAVNHVLTYRDERGAYTGSKKEFDKSYTNRLHPDATDTSRNTYSKDYPDLITRYSRY